MGQMRAISTPAERGITGCGTVDFSITVILEWSALEEGISVAFILIVLGRNAVGVHMEEWRIFSAGVMVCVIYLAH